MADFGSCVCCGQYGIVTLVSDPTIWTCGPCWNRTPEECKTVHEAVVRGQRLKAEADRG